MKKKRRFAQDENDELTSDSDGSVAMEDGGKDMEDAAEMTEPFGFVPKSRSRKHPRRFATWSGGALIANLRGMREMWTTKRQFEELGADLAVDGRRF